MSTGGNPRHRTWDPKMSRWDPGPPKRHPGPMTPKYSNEIWNPGTSKCDPGLGTPKYLSGTQGFQFSIVLIIYSTLNTVHFTCYKTSY